MTHSNEQAITVLLSSDPTVKKEDREKALRILRGEEQDEKKEIAEGLSKLVISREDVAEMLGVSLSTVSRWGKMGKFELCKNGKKGYGYRYESVVSFISECTKAFNDEEKAA